MKIHRFIATLLLIGLTSPAIHGQVTVDDSRAFTSSPNGTMVRTSSYTFQTDGTFDPALEDSTIPGALSGFDPTNSDKIVVTVSGENTDDLSSVTYGGEELSEAVVANNGSKYTRIYYLDNPSTVGDLVFTLNSSANGLGGSIIAASGTVLGAPAETVSNIGQSATISTTGDNPLLVASHVHNGGGGTTIDSPFTLLFSDSTGSSGGASAYLNPAPTGTYTATFDGSTDSPATTIASFASTLPINPNPNGGIIAGGEVELSWQNLAPNSGTDVWVDVWFGTDSGNLTQVVTADPDGLNRTTFTTDPLVAGTYYWRVDSYLDGSPSGTPTTGTLLTFTIIDTDSDGLPDEWELLYSDPSSPTSIDPNGNLDGDTLTNLEEFELGTDPTKTDTDDDGLDDHVETNTGTFVDASDTGTDPLNDDTDGDGLEDGVESDTGTFVDANDTGTDPLNPDTDGDGLLDGVETNTGTFVDASDAGTDPHDANTDGDNATDWYEVTAAFTDPVDPSSQPPLPYPLPDPDSSPGAADKPIKVYIMSGQSNMVGFGTVNGTGDDTLETMIIRQNKFPNLTDGSGGWTTRQDVRYRGVISDFANTLLSAGNLDSTFGPELGFGYIMGWYHDEPVLLLKSCTGNRGLGWDILPPGSPSYDYEGQTYAGYGEGPSKRPIGDPPATDPGWWAGREYDAFFMDESDWGVPQGAVTNVVDVLDNFASEYPEWAGQGFQIAGFVWWQGDKDRYDLGYASRYEQNLVNLIDSLRNYYSNRYPGQVAANAPFVLATLGQSPLDETDPAEKAILDAQLAVDGDAGNYPQYAGNVKTVYSNPLSQGGASNSHYNKHAGTYMLVGDALGSAMVSLLEEETPPAPNPMTFEIAPSGIDATTIGMAATEATSANGPVEYYFENTTNSTTSGWTTDRTWNETGLTTGQVYSYRVKTRDSNGLEGEWSVTADATAEADTTAPAPDPMTFETVPTALGETSVTMTATTALDVNGVEYYFENTIGPGNDSGWQDSPEYTDTGLAHSTAYSYRVRARDKSPAQNVTVYSSAAPATTDSPDLTAPTPDPMTFGVVPTADGENSISMTASTASDESGVEYYFEETTENPGGTDSGWQDSPDYTDTGLASGTTYSYRVQARDKSPAQNTTGWSAIADATTETPDTTPPAPDPMTFATPPAPLGASAITMSATTATDESGVEYYFEATDGGNDSGWQNSPDYTDTGLTPETTYSYRVQARDKSAAQNATGWSATASATTGSISSVAVTNSKTVEGARTGDGENVSITEPGWSLTGGNAIAVYFSAENGQTFTASYGGQPMTVVEVFDGDRFVAGIAYLINPNVTQGDVVIDATNSGDSRLSHAYSILSLSGVDSVAAVDSRTGNGNLTYTTATDGGYVLASALNNSYSGTTLPDVSGNPNVIMLQTNVDGNASMLHAHGAVATAGSYTDSYSGGIESAATVAFNSGGGSGGDSPFSTWTDTFPSLSDTTPSLDFDEGGLATALEWALGGDPTDASDDLGLVPTADATSDPDGKLLVTFRRNADAQADEDTTIAVEYGSDLSGTWTAATHQGTGPDDITITETPDGFGPGIDQVTVALPASLTADDKLFARLSVIIATP